MDVIQVDIEVTASGSISEEIQERDVEGRRERG